MNRTPLTLALAAALAIPAGGALAEYPEGPVTFVVPWPPGDLEDVLTRMIAEDFQAAYGQPAAVLNRPGGGGGPFPGAVEVAAAPADGSTVGSFVIGVPVVGPTIGIPELNPDPFAPVGIFLTYPFVMATSADAPYHTMQELAAYAQDNDVLLGHFGAQLTPTQVSFALAHEMGFAWGADAAYDALDCNTLASGDVDVINTTIQLIMPCLDQVTILAAITGDRLALARASDEDLGHHDRDADQGNAEKIDQDKEAAAVLARDVRELPDVAQADRRAGRRQHEPQPASPLRALVAHGVSERCPGPGSDR